jgi:hypothetical protein
MLRDFRLASQPSDSRHTYPARGLRDLCRLSRFGMALTILGALSLLTSGCEDEPPSQKPGPPAHQKKKAGAKAQKVKPATDTQAPVEDAGDVEVDAAPEVAEAPKPKPVLVNGPDEWPGAPPADDDPMLVTRPKTVVTPPAAACGLGMTSLQQSVSLYAPKKPPTLKIVSPKAGSTLQTTRLRIQARVTNFPTWKSTKSGSQYIAVILDNEAPRKWYDPTENAFAIDGLSPGWHSLRVLAVRPWGEVARAPEAFDAINFYVRTKRGSPDPVDMTKPFATYAGPSGTYNGLASRRILLDFHVANVALKPGGHRMQVALDKNPPFEVTSWAPLWLEEVPNGKHTVRLTLLGPDGTAVGGPFKFMEGKFEVKREQ